MFNQHTAFSHLYNRCISICQCTTKGQNLNQIINSEMCYFKNVFHGIYFTLLLDLQISKVQRVSFPESASKHQHFNSKKPRNSWYSAWTQFYLIWKLNVQQKIYHFIYPWTGKERKERWKHGCIILELNRTMHLSQRQQLQNDEPPRISSIL